MAVKLLIAVGLVVLLFVSGRLDLNTLGDVTNPGHLVWAMALLVLAALAPVWRWMMLLRTQELQIDAWTAVRMTWMGYFASLFLPGAAGGDLAKAYVACRHQPDAKTRAVSTVFLDRLTGLHTMLTLGAASGVVVLLVGGAIGAVAAAWMAILIWAGVSVGAVLMFWARTARIAAKLIPDKLRKPMRESLALYRARPRGLLWIWLFSIFCNVLAILPYALVASSLGLAPSMAELALVVPLVILFNSLPLSPGGLGVGEAAGSELFSAFGIPGGAMIVLMVRLGSVLAFLPGALGLLWPLKATQRPGTIPDAVDLFGQRRDLPATPAERNPS